MRVGIDLGGSHIGIGIIENGKIIEKMEKDIVKNETENEILRYIDNSISNILNGIDEIEYIGIATPGYKKRRSMKNLVNLGIPELDFDKIIRKYKPVPFIIQNDAKMAAVAEKKYGVLKDYEDSVFLCLGTGIGSGVFLNGELLQTSSGLGFELGHMIIEKDGIQCKCGKKGCFETYCSMKRFKENAKDILKVKEISSIELLELIKKEKQNSKIDKLIQKYIDNLIIGFSNIIDIFQPEAIALGGSFVYYNDVFYDKLVKEMNSRKYAFYKEKLPKILLAELGNDAGMIGVTTQSYVN